MDDLLGNMRTLVNSKTYKYWLMKTLNPYDCNNCIVKYYTL